MTGEGVAGQRPPSGSAPHGRWDTLPLPLTSFVGRDRELVAVRGRLLRDGVRLLTLTGPGGVGKTRLALRVAGDIRDRFPDGAWLVDLAPLADPAQVPRAVAAVLGVQEGPGRPLQGRLADALRSRCLLLVLDNCEHLLDACARLADALLGVCPMLTILATSREALGIAGETAWPVPPLSLPSMPDARNAQGQPPLEELRRSEAVRLFADRAAAARSAFRLTDENASAVAQVCRRLDGLPLAIELAAARARALPVAQLLGRLEARFRLLTGGSRTAPGRHQTLQAAVDWSHDLLTQPEQALFARLSVFVGGWTLEAAEQVCAGDGIAPEDVLDLLTRLVDKSLVAVDEQPDGTARYRFLETIRQYAQHKLTASGRAEAFGGRHRAWCERLAEQWAAAWPGRGTGPWRRILGAEYANLQQVLAWYEARDPESGLRLALRLFWFWLPRGQYVEACRWLERLLAGAPHPTPLRAQALRVLGRLYREHGELERARPFLDEGLGLCRALGHRAGVANLLNQYGLIAAAEGNPERALALHEEALAIFEEVGDLEGVATSLRDVGLLAIARADYTAAAEAYARAVAASRARGDVDSVATATLRLGIIARLRGDDRRSRDLVEEGIGQARGANWWPGVYVGLGALGELARARGAYAQAWAHYADLLNAARENGHDQFAEVGLGYAGALAVQQGDHARGVRLLAAVGPETRTSVRMHMPDLHTACEAGLATARSALGEAHFEAAWAAGRALGLEEAVAYALAGGAAAAVAVRSEHLAAHGTPDPPTPLTARQREVAALIAQGLTNRQIAERLVVSPHTVERHVEHILGRLGLSSRTQIAAWAGGRGHLPSLGA